jgi:uncharacterized protein YndB with AHSA1/START domain
MSTATMRYAIPSEVEFQIKRTVDAPRELVYDCFTKPEHLTHWMLGPDGWSMPVCELDLRPGGAWHYQWRHEGGDTMEMHGVVVEVVPPERLVTTESWGGPYPETVNTVTFEEVPGSGTLITTTIRYPSTEARDAALQTGMTKGVQRSYERLEQLLSGLQSDRGGK